MSATPIDVSKDLDATFQFPKIHMMFHWVEQICRYGGLQQYSVERRIQVPKMNLKDGWNASKHNLYCLLQLITSQHRIFCFEIRDLHPQAIAQHPKDGNATCKVLPSGADLAAPLSSKFYAKP
jgi:hypothetical protein